MSDRFTQPRTPSGERCEKCGGVGVIAGHPSNLRAIAFGLCSCVRDELEATRAEVARLTALLVRARSSLGRAAFSRDGADVCRDIDAALHPEDKP
jgi:hypothetical protein